ncbi:MAG: hypothetical protein GEU78_09650 [Actinobacteria bacterium]|nr:hypothetical protein [Actinomycetota bacterium]
MPSLHNDFLDDYSPADCPVQWCDRGTVEHDRSHQGVIWSAVRMPPPWRGRSIMTAQAVLAGFDEETYELGLTLISETLAQMSVVLEWEQVEQLRDALTSAMEQRSELAAKDG